MINGVMVTLGQFNILVCLQTGYSAQPELKTVTNVVNFDAPTKYNSYKENGSHIDADNGAILTLVTPSAPEEVDALALSQRKMQKAFSVPNMIKCIPVMWQELLKIKGRVEDVTRSLDNKTVKTEKTNEFKKQLISNKRLKEYFAQHPEEKEILINDVQKSDVTRNAIMYKHLSHLPFYVIPQQIMPITIDQIRTCTTGIAAVMAGHASGSLSKDRTLTGTLITGAQVADPMEIFADPTVCQSSLIQNLASLPAVVKNFQQQDSATAQAAAEQQDAFAYEEPTMMNFEQLEPTSGRKRWKMKHHKRIKKKERPMKNGYQGS